MTRTKKSLWSKRLVAAIIIVALMLGITITGVVKTKAEDAGGGGFTLGENLFASGNFEVLTDQQTEITLGDPATAFGKDLIGSLVQFDSPGKIVKDGTNGCLKLSYTDKPFASIFATWSSFGKIPGGEYVVTLDYKEGGTAFSTDNFGFRFAPEGGETQILTKTATDLTNGWKQVSFSATVEPATRDSIGLWFNTKSLDPAISHMLVDNIKIQKKIFSAQFDEGYLEFQKSAPVDLVFKIDMMGNSFEKISFFGETVADTNYTFTDGADADAGKKILTVKKEYLGSLTKGLKTFTFTTSAGDVDFKIYIVPSRPVIPEVEDYEMTDTLKGGDFENLEVGFKLSMTQTEDAWGSLTSYDDGGEIASIDGTKALMIKRTTGSNRMYASAFAMLLPSALEEDNIFTMSFDYKLDVTDATQYEASRITFSFVSAGNDTNHEVYLRSGAKQTETGKGTSNFSWPITFTEKENGWVNATFSFVADNRYVGMNSMRFLFELTDGDNDKVYIDNATLKLWESLTAEDEEVPTITVSQFAFDKADQKDIEMTCDLKGYNTPTIRLGTETVISTNYTVSTDKTKITLKKEYLKTLSNGEKSFTLSTPGGAVSFKVAISGSEVIPPVEKKDKGCGGAVSATVLLSLGALFFVGKRSI